MDAPTIAIVVSPGAIARRLTAVVLLLVLAGVVSQLVRFLLPDFPGRDTLVQLFDPNREQNVPTWYASTQLLACAVLIALVALMTRRERAPYVAHWTALAIIFLALSLDEAAAIHNRAPDLLPRTGLAFYGWVALGAAVVSVFALAYLRFLLHLPLRTRTLVAVAGAGYVAGAIGGEVLGGLVHQALGTRQHVLVSLTATLEEAVEMLAIVVLIYALLDYLHGRLAAVQARFERTPRETPASV